MADALRGRCLCGGVKYEATGDFSEMVHCHCSRCRRGGGAAHATVVVIARENFRLTHGQDLIRTYREEGFTARTSCSTCGSSLYGEFPPSGMCLDAGALNSDSGLRPQAHIMVDYKAPWHEITDDLPQHPELPPES